MEYPNENMEEFFKNSLNRFSEVPSDIVWDDLDKRLDDDKPGAFILNWFKSLIFAAMLLAGFSFFYYQQQQLLRDYKRELSTLSNENNNLREKLALTTTVSHSPLTPPQSMLQETDNLNGNTSQIKWIRDTVFIIKHVPHSQRQGNLPFSNASLTMIGTDELRPFSVLNYPRPQLFLSKEFKTSWATLENTPIPLSKEEGTPKFVMASSTVMPDLSKRMRLSVKDKSKRKRKKHKPYQGPIILDKDPWGQPEFSYHLGVSITALNSLKGEQFSNSSIGFGYGVVQEIGLSSRFAVTSGVFRNIQDYALSNTGAPLALSQIETFPNQENYLNNIIRVEVENKYYEFPVGVKYDFYKDNQKSFFISPALEWSIHQPQQFTYFLTENRIHTFSSERRFGYLNGVNLSIGIEKIMNPFIRYQFSLGYDHSITEIGVEKQRLNSLFFRGSVLFGK